MSNRASESSLRIPDLANPIHKLSDEECVSPKKDGNKGVRGVVPEVDGSESWWGWLDELFEVPYLAR